jgi:hypothetical protein
MLTFDLFADLQKGSGSNIGLPKRIGQTAFSSSSVAAVHCVAVIVPAGAWTAKCALSHWSGSPVVDPGSVHVPATHCAAAGAVVAQPVAQVVVVVPGSHEPGVEPLSPLEPAPSIPEASRASSAPVFPPPLVDAPLLPLAKPDELPLPPWLPPVGGESEGGVVPQAVEPKPMPSTAATTEMQ